MGEVLVGMQRCPCTVGSALHLPHLCGLGGELRRNVARSRVGTHLAVPRIMLTHPYERYDDTQYDPFDERVVVRRGPHPGIAAVLSVVIPGLGQVYNGRLLAGAMWFLLTTFGYAAILVPGFLFHVASVWCAYQGARRWTGY